MCGIVGYAGNVNREKISKMLYSIAHRGPDDSGMFVRGEIGLGNNRLAVIDVSPKGHQPMFDDEKSICIVYNGEMYNFMDVRRKLEKEFKFRSNSDTEVIIYAYKKWGTGCLKYLNGMFAFVIYDMRNRLLFGARDRLGEKPLKYYFDGDDFIFASEVKAILSVIKNKPEMDLEAVNDFLTLQYVPAPATGFKNIFKLPPASYFIYKNRRLSIKKYWHLDFSDKLNLSENEWTGLLDEKINMSVKSRMVSDVPIGAFLSGGIDSGATTAYMARNSLKPIKTFSIGFTDKNFDETKHSKEIAKLYKTDHSYIKVHPAIFKEEISKIADYYDEPFADNSLIPSLFLSRFARQKVTVALSGDGGDENFAGYDRYNIVKFGKIYSQIPKGIRSTLVNPVTDLAFLIHPNLLTKRIETFAGTFDSPFYRKYLYYRSFFSDHDKKNIYTRMMKNTSDTFAKGKRDYEKKLDWIDSALKTDINSYLPEDLLYKMDIASMSASLEVRAPLLDYELMELTAKIPPGLKIKGFNKKYIFKQMLIKNNILPEEIINRPKKGFNPPLGRWLKKDLKKYVYELLNAKKLRQSGIFDDKKLDDYIDRYYSTDLNYHNNIFALMTLSNWIEKYF